MIRIFRWLLELIDRQPMRVFVNYRFDDTQFPDERPRRGAQRPTSVEARRLTDGLRRELGDVRSDDGEHQPARSSASVFLDADDLLAAGDWRDELKAAHRLSSVLLCLIGRRWLEPGRNGRPRLHDESDVLRDELVLALEGRTLVIPVLIDGAEMPAPSELPVHLTSRGFNYLHSLSVVSDNEDSIRSLAEQIQRTCRSFRRRELDSRARRLARQTATGLLLIGAAATVGVLAAPVIPDLALAGLMLLMVLAVLLAPVLFHFRSYRLLRRLRAEEPGFFPGAALRDFYKCVWSALGRNIPHVVQVRTEASLIIPVPPMPATVPGTEEYREWKQSLQRRRQDIDRAVHDALQITRAGTSGAERPVLRVETFFQLNNAASQISRYFAELRARGTTGKEPTGFFCAIDIRQGFIAPQYLVAGLQSQYEEAWPVVLDWYGKAVRPDLKPAGELNSCPPSRDYELSAGCRQLQIFQFLCWLMWGPSIPVCRCSEWQVHHAGAAQFAGAMLQFGYGDENNSWLLCDNPVADPVTGRTVFPVHDFIQRSMSVATGVAAWQCGAEVELFELSQASARLCRAQRRELDVAPIALRVRSLHPFEAAQHPPEILNRRIYQAYVWVMFVICDEQGTPLYDDQRWLGLLPFFIHGNIAEAETHAFVRREVVRKSLSALRELMDMAPRCVFRFACSSDESNCGSELLFAPPSPTMRELLIDEYQRLPAEVRQRLLISGQSAPRPDEAAFAKLYSSCHIPDIVEEFYRHVAIQQQTVSELRSREAGTTA